MALHDYVFYAYGGYMASSLSNQFGKLLNHLSYSYSSVASEESSKMKCLIRRQHAMEIMDGAFHEKEQQQPSSLPTWVPPHHSLLFQSTTKKLTRHGMPLRKQVLLKQIFNKLQTTKRHGMIMTPAVENHHSPKFNYRRTHGDHRSQCQASEELSYLHNKGHQKYYQRRKPRQPQQAFVAPPTIKTDPISMSQRKRLTPPSPVSPPLSSKALCNNGSNSDDDDDVPLGTLISHHHQQQQQKRFHRTGICTF